MVVKSVEEYIQKHPKWNKELLQIRELVLTTGLEETIKWGAPVYTLNTKNVVGLAAFKNHFALWFYQGALLKEHTSLLHNPQEGKTKIMRQIRFEKEQTLPLPELKKYVLEAIKNQKQGKVIKPETNKKLVIPVQLKTALKNNEALHSSFSKLTPGKQREFTTYIIEAKREATKLKRLEKIEPLILAGKGLYDKYKNC